MTQTLKPAKRSNVLNDWSASALRPLNFERLTILTADTAP